MHKHFAKLTTAVFCAALLAAVGCGGRKTNGPIAEKSPDWVNRGSAAFKDGGVSVFYGVGIAQGIRNRALSVTAADDRARAEIAKILETYVSRLGKSYANSVTAGDMSKSSEEQSVTDTLKSFTKTTLHGAVIIDHWKDPADGTMFSLAKLDMAAVAKMMGDAKELDAKVRDYVKANAEKAFDDLSAEEAKH